MIKITQTDSLNLLTSLKPKSVDLVITSPPYNMSKFTNDNLSFDEYLQTQSVMIKAFHRVLKDTGAVCYQVGMYVKDGAIKPLDIETYQFFKDFNFKLRNRIIWHFGHGLHCSNRLSGRYESVMWYTKSDQYTFNLDAIRIPQKYPNKRYFKGAKKGQLSGNPLGKNPSDIWEISNVANNHPEKTDHPAQFPEEIIRRLVLSLTNEGDMVVDPYIGSGTTAIVCSQLNRNCIGSDIDSSYVNICNKRLNENSNK